MLIDTLSHLASPHFDANRCQVIQRAQNAGVAALVVSGINLPSIEATIQICENNKKICFPAFGIHPFFSHGDKSEDFVRLCQYIEAHRPVILGEIGLDLFKPDALFSEQISTLTTQLKIAKTYELPVLLHVRRAYDQVLALLRRIRVSGGIVHAFNGSAQQASDFLKLGFCLGFGGNLTYTRSKRIRRLATDLPSYAIVLETDAPYIPPAWCTMATHEPHNLPGIAQTLALLRQQNLTAIIQQTGENAVRMMPSLASSL